MSNCKSDGAPISAFATQVYSGAAVEPGGGGGVAAIKGARIESTDTTFEGCTCGNMGAAVLIGAGSTGIMTRATVLNTHAGASGAIASILGGALHLVDSTLTKTSCGLDSSVYDASYGFSQYARRMRPGSPSAAALARPAHACVCFWPPSLRVLHAGTPA